MVSIKSSREAQDLIARHSRERRLSLQLTQEELSARSGVCLGTLRQFEQQGMISLVNFLKIHAVLETLDKIVNAVSESALVPGATREIHPNGRVR